MRDTVSVVLQGGGAPETWDVYLVLFSNLFAFNFNFSCIWFFLSSRPKTCMWGDLKTLNCPQVCMWVRIVVSLWPYDEQVTCPGLQKFSASSRIEDEWVGGWFEHFASKFFDIFNVACLVRALIQENHTGKPQCSDGETGYYSIIGYYDR